MRKFRNAFPAEVEAMLFTDIDSCFRICRWMKDCGDTHALAGEVRYSTPILLLPTTRGTMAANPGDWVVRDEQGFRVMPANTFTALFDPVWEAVPA